MTREQILSVLAAIGSEVRHNADPSSYSHEYRDRAAKWLPVVQAYREAYRAILKGEEPVLILRKLLHQTPPTGKNAVDRLIDAIEGNHSGINHPYIQRMLRQSGDPQ